MSELFDEVSRSALEARAYKFLSGFEETYEEVDNTEVVFLSSPLMAGADLEAARESVYARFRRELIISSTDLEVDDWTSHMSMRFWGEVIDLYADHIVFADGWQDSENCVFEFMIAWNLGVPMYDAECNTLSPNAAIDLLNNAIADKEDLGHPDTMQAEALELVVSDLVDEYVM